MMMSRRSVMATPRAIWRTLYAGGFGPVRQWEKNIIAVVKQPETKTTASFNVH
jgi:hypothetical protein